jgi:mannose-1-phosphate guanylyltransferase
LIQIAFQRITPLIPVERVLIVTGRRYVNEIQRQLPALPPRNIIAEPDGRNTAPAIGLGAVHLRRRDPNAVMAVLTADHVMRKEDVFRAALAAAARATASGHLLTMGITPAGPETGYGYIERSAALETGMDPDLPIYAVSSFREKPGRPEAETYVSSGRFFWNSGMFIWRVCDILDEIKEQLPDLFAALTEIEAGLGTADEVSRTSQAWSSIEPISIDYGVMENARKVAVLPADPGWNDVGSWSAVYEESQQTPGTAENVVQGGELLSIDSSGCLVRSKKLVATIDLHDLVIIETEDVLFVAPRSETQRVKELVSTLKVRNRQEYL